MDISIDCDCVEEKTENQLRNLPNTGGMEDVLTLQVPIGEKDEDGGYLPYNGAMEDVLPPQVSIGDKVEVDDTQKPSLVKKKKKTISPQVKVQPLSLVTDVLEEGDPNGKMVCKGAKVKVHAIAKVKDSDEQPFESRICRLKLGDERLIEGLRIGIIGMRVGDKRRFTIPPSMGYGDEGFKGVVPPNSWLVYEIKLLAHGRAN
ncbi:peptidylprolyl isomerase [Salvia divinorum]|uniref:peptidylprolyl isomerase n=1 Tax=Salvia divinorum TaxID=28513 RepID=A0ABD1FH83_SALDI